ncbi:antibiotic biosynthesis monooxygenase [Paractinoplanes toevensis]|uniref:antibiotic biosynthesis monooxygenase n=1 Tax=Paractinoplanes toevensis TaxID=571911 RepID=UPI001BB3BE95|nr:antibiotic biosynthesis monooxygenase [Actinoplanes toevensis]
MTTIVEFARFTVRDGAEEKLVADRPAMLAALRERFPACLAAYLTREDDGTWVDVLIWRSRAEAEESAAQIATIPECAAWLAHIAESGGIRHGEVLHAWPAL